MGYWSYCRHRGCDMPVAEPTIREVIEGVQYCADGHRNEATMSRDDVLIELVERVEALEEKLRSCSCSGLPES